MQLSICPQPLYDRSLDAACEFLTGLGVSAIELPVDQGSPWVPPDGSIEDVRATLDRHGVTVSAVSIHREGQLLLGPHHADTDPVCTGSPTEKAAFAARRIVDAGRIAQALGVETVVGFVGCEDYSRWFPWPDARGWEKMLPTFRERMLPILDQLDAFGVRFAQEPHPRQIVYNTETALESVDVLDEHPRWGFNLDTANLMLADADPVVFIAELGARVWHVHAKDGERVAHNIARSGLLAHGAWARKDRGFRFRVAGWGDVDWRRVISELIVVGYGGHVAIEHEDPLFGREDGLRKAVDTLRPMLPTDPPAEPWW